MRGVITQRFRENLARVENLLEIYRGSGSGTSGRRPVQAADVLRAAVVFLHATVEELMRALVIWKLPSASAEVLDGVPLVGQPSSGRAEKFLLGRLAAHRSKTVKQVVEESVRDYSNTMNVNNTTDLAALLTCVDVEVAKVQSRCSDLSKLMLRRHAIVHQADRNEQPGQGQHKARSLGETQVVTWISAVREFGEAVLKVVPQ